MREKREASRNVCLFCCEKKKKRGGEKEKEEMERGRRMENGEEEKRKEEREKISPFIIGIARTHEKVGIFTNSHPDN